MPAPKYFVSLIAPPKLKKAGSPTPMTGPMRNGPKTPFVSSSFSFGDESCCCGSVLAGATTAAGGAAGGGAAAAGADVAGGGGGGGAGNDAVAEGTGGTADAAGGGSAGNAAVAEPGGCGASAGGAGSAGGVSEGGAAGSLGAGSAGTPGASDVSCPRVSRATRTKASVRPVRASFMQKGAACPRMLQLTTPVSFRASSSPRQSSSRLSRRTGLVSAPLTRLELRYAV